MISVSCVESYTICWLDCRSQHLLKTNLRTKKCDIPLVLPSISLFPAMAAENVGGTRPEEF